MSLVAGGIEARGIPTLVIGTVRDILTLARPPRAVFVDFPVGRTFGRPHDATQQQRMLAAALAELDNFGQPGEIRALPDEWAAGDRSWEQLVQTELAQPHV